MIADSEQQVIDRSKELALHNAIKEFIEKNHLNERKPGSTITFELSFIRNYQHQCRAGENLEERIYNIIYEYLTSELNLSLDDIDSILQILQSNNTHNLIILSEV